MDKPAGPPPLKFKADYGMWGLVYQEIHNINRALDRLIPVLPNDTDRTPKARRDRAFVVRMLNIKYQKLSKFTKNNKCETLLETLIKEADTGASNKGKTSLLTQNITKLSSWLWDIQNELGLGIKVVREEDEITKARRLSK